MAARKPGHPTDFRPDYVAQAEKLCKLGATDMEIADFFEVSVRTIYRWQTTHPKFCQALKSGKEAADERVERSLFHRAVGYTFDAVKIFPPRGDGEVIKTPYREHVPPDTTAAIFWLKNRRKAEWRDRQEHELTGKDGGPIETADVTDDMRAKALAAFIARTRPKGDADEKSVH